jgi:ankyrin repeat protein
MTVRRATLALAIIGVYAAHAFAAEHDGRLSEAAKRQDVASVRALLRQRADVNGALPDGTTALHWAVETEDLEMVGLLIRAGAKVTVQNRYGVTPLALATSHGHAAIVRLLLESGADPNAVDAGGETVLMSASRSGSIETVTALVEHGAVVNAKDSATEQTALMLAVRANHVEAVRLLLDRGADVNARTRTGKTPDWRPPNFGGGSHGLGIIRGGWPERGFRDVVPGAMSALLYAARDGRLELARMLLEAKADINQSEANGMTPLLMAVTNEHAAAARLLIERGAEIKTADWWGRTPLWAAVEIRNRDYTRTNEHGIDRPAMLDLVKTLLEAGANPNTQTREIPPIRRWVTPLSDLSWVEFVGQTPFIRAALSGDITVMRLLLDHGANPNIKTFGGTTALMAASGANWVVQQSYTESKESLLEAVRLCLEKGADVNAANATGLTAVMGAANRGSDDILEVLVRAGARLDVQDNQGRTPLRWAQGEFLALHPPEAKPSTIALIQKLMAESSSVQNR